MKKIILGTLTLTLALQAQSVYAILNATADKEALLSTSISGVVKAMKVDVGSRVKKGEVLLELDGDDLSRSLDVAKADLLTLKEQYRFASVQLERYTKVKDLLSKEEYDKLEHDKNLKYSAIKQAEATIAYKETLLSKTLLKAPFNGVISEKLIESGAVLNPGTGAFKLINGTTKLVIEFDEKYAKNVRLGDFFEFKIDGMNTLQKTRITKIYPTVDSKTRRIKAEAFVNGVKPGQFGEGNIITKD